MDANDLKIELLDTIAKARTCLDIIASCEDEIRDLLPMKNVRLVRSWINLLEEDVKDDIIPAFRPLLGELKTIFDVL